MFIDLCYKNMNVRGGVGGQVAQPGIQSIMIFKLIVVKNVISSQVTGLFAFDTFLY